MENRTEKDRILILFAHKLTYRRKKIVKKFVKVVRFYFLMPFVCQIVSPPDARYCNFETKL